MRFKKNKVWVALNPDGQLMEKNGKVLIKYQLEQDHEYWVYKSSIQSLELPEIHPEKIGSAKSGEKFTKKRATADKSIVQKIDINDIRDAVCIYTDGASSGNPGPSGIGVLMCFGDQEKEISRSIGVATNNIAELEAIRTGLSAMKATHIPVRIYTDSSYAQGVLIRGWRVKKNKDLIESTRKLMSTFKDLKLIKVKGHAGIPGNERANKLATDAVSKSESE